MRPSQVLTEAEQHTIDHETVVDMHFVTPKPGEKENHIRCYCRICKRMIKDFNQDNYDLKFVHMINGGNRSQAEAEIIQAWLQHECKG